MKRHKPFRTALSVSLQERRDLFPELTDGDVVTALNNIAGQIQANITRQRRKAKEAADRRMWDEILARPRQQPHATAPSEVEIAEKAIRTSASDD
jgi:hypothetical protein